MSEAQTTQAAVTTTPAPAQPGATVESARNEGDDLDTLLNEFQERTTPAPTSTQPGPTPGAESTDLKTLAEEVRGLRTERQQERFKADMNKTIESVRGDLSADTFDDALVRGYIDARAEQDPRLAQAWANRHANPKAFNKVVDQLGREFRQKFKSLPDSQATEDRAAVTDAVRGASTRAPEGKPPNYAALNNSEFQAEKDKLFGG